MSVVLNGEFTVLLNSCRDLLLFLYFFFFSHINVVSYVNIYLFSSLQVPSLHSEQGRAIQQLLMPAFPLIQTPLLLRTLPEAALQRAAAEAATARQLQLMLTFLRLKVSFSAVVMCGRCKRRLKLIMKSFPCAKHPH